MPIARTYLTRRLWHYLLAVLLLITLTWAVVSLLGPEREGTRPGPPSDPPATSTEP